MEIQVTVRYEESYMGKRRNDSFTFCTTECDESEKELKNQAESIIKRAFRDVKIIETTFKKVKNTIKIDDL